MISLLRDRRWIPNWADRAPLLEKTEYLGVSTSDSETNSTENGSERIIYSSHRSNRQSCLFRTTTILIFALLNLAVWATIWFQPGRGRPEGVADRLFPLTPYETIIFHDDHIMPGPETDKIWKEALPHGHGFTVVDKPDLYGLPRGVAYADGFNKYGVSWAHQYHCVWMLKDAFWDLVNNNSSLVGIDAHERSKEGAELWHLAHCFGYLRQHILCNMDMSLEWPTLGGANEGTINGYEIPHQCKRREPLDTYMDEHAPDPNLLVNLRKPDRKSHKEIIEGA